MNFPDNLRYSKEHEWVKVDGDVATIGITDFAQSELGDIVYVEVDTVGDTVELDEVFGTIEAVKTVSDLFMPITGEILELNEALEGEPEGINSAPYDNWIIKVKIADAAQLDSLMSVEDYKAMVNG